MSKAPEDDDDAFLYGNNEQETNEQDQSASDSDEDDLEIVVNPNAEKPKQEKTLVGMPIPRQDSSAAQEKQGVDLDLVGQYDGVDIFDVDPETFADKPWRKPGADITDYFNFGFNEQSWKAYCNKQKSLREEFTMDARYKSYDDSRQDHSRQKHGDSMRRHPPPVTGKRMRDFDEFAYPPPRGGYPPGRSGSRDHSRERSSHSRDHSYDRGGREHGYDAGPRDRHPPPPPRSRDHSRERERYTNSHRRRYDRR
jgi:hypothetical protein